MAPTAARWPGAPPLPPSLPLPPSPIGGADGDSSSTHEPAPGPRDSLHVFGRKLAFLLFLPARTTATAQLIHSRPASQGKRDVLPHRSSAETFGLVFRRGGLRGAGSRALPGSLSLQPAAPSPANHLGLMAGACELLLDLVSSAPPSLCGGRKTGSWGIPAARLPSAPRVVSDAEKRIL